MDGCPRGHAPDPYLVAPKFQADPAPVIKWTDLQGEHVTRTVGFAAGLERRCVDRSQVPAYGVNGHVRGSRGFSKIQPGVIDVACWVDRAKGRLVQFQALCRGVAAARLRYLLGV